VKPKLAPFFLLVSLVSGCYFKPQLYPVQGPLTAQSPIPVARAKVHFGLRSGDVSAVLDDGEVLTGRWTSAQKAQAPPNGGIAGGPSMKNLPAAWDAVYGPSFYVSHVVGAKLFARAVVNGNRGTVMVMEFYHDVAAKPSVVHVALIGELIDWRSRSLLAQHTFTLSSSVQTDNAEGAVDAFDHAVTEALDALVPWVETEAAKATAASG